MSVTGRDHERIPIGDVGRFTAMVALLAIFIDAALGHGLTWENDPYWTYWVTKTFLIATVFGLGTLWFGVGLAPGAVITAVHTVVLTVYYWTFSPIGMPSSPEWLDLEHTWLTGLPIHFAVIYLGYVVALWLWARRAAVAPRDIEGRITGLSVLVVGTIVVIAAGLFTSLALGTFPGVQWFLVRLLLTIPFLLWWWSWAGRDALAAVTGATMLALVWATYGHFLGPVGLPDTPLRILDPSPPPATVAFLDYRQQWLMALPITFGVAAVTLLVDATRFGRRPLRSAAAPTAAVFGLVALTAAAGPSSDADGADATVEASGEVLVAATDGMTPASGDISIRAEDMGGRVTPLAPRDRLSIDATIALPDQDLTVTVRRPMVEHPLGAHTTWWGVGLGVEHHGDSGIGTSALPSIESELAAFGLGQVSVDGEPAGPLVPIHVMTAEDGLPGDGRLALEVGLEELGAVPELGPLTVIWDRYDSSIEQPGTIRYVIGGLVTLCLLVGAVWLTRREPLGG